ncbi:hypothetical protein ZWY2020_011347 [Hordeum vulgare]|nr:hypothetical protein ZWY2020_011347 [Hordeum vulgare]
MPQVAQYKVALCQLPVSPDKHGNIARARPHRGRRNRRRQARRPAGNMELPLRDGDHAELRRGHRRRPVAVGLHAVGGGRGQQDHHRRRIRTRVASGQLFNTCCVVGPDGRSRPSTGSCICLELTSPETSISGIRYLHCWAEPTVVDTDVGRIGIRICHDIRFPELAMLYRSRGAHLIYYPSAFNMSTGQLLWDLMQKAVDNQSYYHLNCLGFSCSWRPAHHTRPQLQSDLLAWGHSSLIGPFGEVLAAAGHEGATVIGEIDLSLIRAVRENLPLETQGRGDLYRLIDVQRECSS